MFTNSWFPLFDVAKTLEEMDVGVLTVKIHKPEKEKPRKIKITSGK